MPLSNVRRVKNLSAADAADREAAAEFATSAGRKINALREVVRHKVYDLIGGIIAPTVAGVKEFEETLTKADTVKAALATDDMRREYRDSFVNLLDTRFGPTTATPNNEYDFSET